MATKDGKIRLGSRLDFSQVPVPNKPGEDYTFHNGSEARAHAKRFGWPMKNACHCETKWTRFWIVAQMQVGSFAILKHDGEVTHIPYLSSLERA